MSDKSFSVNYINYNATSKDVLIIFEKLLSILNTPLESVPSAPEFGSKLYQFLNRPITEDLEKEIKSEVSNVILLFFPDYKDDFSISVSSTGEDNKVYLRITYKDTYITIDGENTKYL